MENVSINQSIHLSEHFTLGEVTKSRHAEIYNIPSHVAIENLKRVCGWLEALRLRYNLRYVCGSVSPPELGGVRGGLKERQTFHCSDHPAHTGTPPNLGGEEDTPIIISSGYRSPQLNKKIGGVANSNHLTGCAVDIRVENMEQLIRYAAILLDYADESQQEFDELLVERNRFGAIWLHFAVRFRGNRHKVLYINT